MPDDISICIFSFVTSADRKTFMASCRLLWQQHLGAQPNGPFYVRTGVTLEMWKADKRLMAVRKQRSILDLRFLKYSFWDNKLVLYGKQGRTFEFLDGCWQEYTPQGVVTYASDEYVYAQAIVLGDVNVHVSDSK